jgi:hypothetical protein
VLNAVPGAIQANRRGPRPKPKPVAPGTVVYLGRREEIRNEPAAVLPLSPAGSGERLPSRAPAGTMLWLRPDCATAGTPNTAGTRRRQAPEAEGQRQ